MKMPKFSPDQLVAVLLMALVMIGITAWRYLAYR
jgi:hypothetical protein